MNMLCVWKGVDCRLAKLCCSGANNKCQDRKVEPRTFLWTPPAKGSKFVAPKRVNKVPPSPTPSPSPSSVSGWSLIFWFIFVPSFRAAGFCWRKSIAAFIIQRQTRNSKSTQIPRPKSAFFLCVSHTQGRRCAGQGCHKLKLR